MRSAVVGRFSRLVPNGDTLVIDTVGFTNKTWLDQMAHPNTEQLHLIEHYKARGRDDAQLDMVIDDPGAYTKAFNAHRNFTSRAPGFSAISRFVRRTNQRFLDNLGKPAMPAAGK